LFDAVKFIFTVKNGAAKINQETLDKLKNQLPLFINDVLGLHLNSDSTSQQTDTLEKSVALLITLRDKARANKDFETSDLIRDALTAMNIQLFDGKEGTTFKVN
jgi:cysteinyl-tRNA synthetase